MKQQSLAQKQVESKKFTLWKRKRLVAGGSKMVYIGTEVLSCSRSTASFVQI